MGKSDYPTLLKFDLNSWTAALELNNTWNVRWTGSSVAKSFAVHSQNFLVSFLQTYRISL